MFRHHCFFGCLSALFMILLLLLWLETMWSADEKRAVNYWQHFIFLHHHHDQTLWFYLICAISNGDLISSFSLLFVCVCFDFSSSSNRRANTTIGRLYWSKLSATSSVSTWNWTRKLNVCESINCGPLGPQASKLPPFFPHQPLIRLFVYILEFSIYIVICLGSL